VRDTARAVSENLDLVRSVCAAWEQGDFSSSAWAHPEIEFVFVGAGGREQTMGTAGMAENWRGVLDSFHDWRQIGSEYRELDEHRVLVRSRGVGRGRTSGAPVESEGVMLFRVHRGRVTRLVMYPEGERVALPDLGLEA
jgi:ketosteroid isomerase-like protein